MAKQKYTIAALWMEGPLSYLEQLCLKSFVDAGHEVVLYHYGPVENVPERIELADAGEFLPRANFLTHERTGSPALHSDLFRYKMLEKSQDTIWADTDAYCVRPFDTPNGHFYGWESNKYVNGGVLGLPHDSDTLRELLAFTADDFAIPPYYGADYVRQLETARDAGTPVHASEQPWGVWGPHAVTHFLKKTGEIRYALPREALYPFSFNDRRLMLKKGFDTSGHITGNTYSIHLYGRRMRARLIEKENGVPHPDSLLGRLLVKHGIDPEKAPLRKREAPAPEEEKSTPVPTPAPRASRGTSAPTPTTAAPLTPKDKQGRGAVNLTDIADRLHIDKGSQKHRYTELYQMLFLPYRERSIDFTEICGPDNDAPRMSDLPTIRLWLEYFPKARIHGLGSQDFSAAKEEERVDFHHADFSSPETAAASVPDIPAPDIIVDDGSHASHEQQAALCALFPKLKSGGLYIIEDLRWQPPGLERPGITATAPLIQGYLDTGVFTHSDPAIAARLNDLRTDISGCFLFQAQFRKSKKDQLVVLHKR